MDLNFVGQVFLKMLPALPRTLSVTVLPFIAALFLGLMVTLPIVYKIPVLKPLCKVYVSFFRGTPFIGQLFMIYFGLPRMFACLSAMDKIEGFVLTMALNSSAYLSEIIRGAFLAVDRGQIEAAKSINLSRMQTLRLIVIPQAIPVAVPGIVNVLIDAIKGSSLAFTIGILDITAVAKIQAGITFRYFEAYMAMVMMYWFIVLVLEQMQKRYEQRIKLTSA
ncbi:amino acid ABC transporter permease [Fretibacterium fastidiosum]|uniref:Amine acid ABC transporter, permease protein, 3-TM region, His/Glu/Gln/Arg/opine family n=1 Tax=Fretibacterium fastidiosum TaxID=651822 RepID=A0AB94IX42_9BACT|nr:amino acid ABC transporter permease [Fretibacterium fastidiosum]CBL28345.1 amine acid ABC transporter, permease protein, 3-TM region, His/Glu/Gln/Arg/opine family [Fretibacterium fastidiosum]